MILLKHLFISKSFQRISNNLTSRLQKNRISARGTVSGTKKCLMKRFSETSVQHITCKTKSSLVFKKSDTSGQFKSCQFIVINIITVFLSTKDLGHIKVTIQ